MLEKKSAKDKNLEQVFLKTDLHIHSYLDSSSSRKFEQDKWEEKIKEVDLDVISITDHNTINKRIYDWLEKNTDKKILIGVELNINFSKELIEKYGLSVDDEEKNYFHAILIFDIKNEDIEAINNILDTEKNIVEGKIGGFDFESLIEKFAKYKYYFIPHEGKGERNLSNYINNETDKNKKFKEKLFFYNYDYAIEGNNNKGIKSYFRSNLHKKLASFSFSDPGNIDVIGQKFMWINFNGSFKDLSSAFIYPDTRIFSYDATNPQKNADTSNFQENAHPSNPQKNADTSNFQENAHPSNPQKNADAFFIKNKEIYFENKKVELKLSPGYNVIIGERGSGKSNLLNIIISGSGYNELIFGKSVTNNNSDIKPLVISQDEFQIFFSGENNNINDISILKNIIQEKKENIKNEKSKITENIKSYFKTINSAKINVENKKTKKQERFFLVGSSNSNIKKCENFLKDDQIFSHNNIELENLILGINNFKITENFETTEGEKYTKIITEINSQIIELKKQVKLLEPYKKRNKIRKKYQEKLAECVNRYLQSIDSEKNTKENHNRDTSEFLIEQYKYNKVLLFELDRIDKLITNLNTLTSNKKTEKFNLKSHNNCFPNAVEFINDKLLKSVNITDLDGIIGVKTEDIKNNTKNDKNIVTILKELVEEVDKNNLEYNIYMIDKESGEEKDILTGYSPGERASNILNYIFEVFKEEDYNVLIIDQPEDNLDNKTISKVITEKIKELKLEKQIIVSSHSAPIVVNSDPDRIIVCNKFDDFTDGILSDKEITDKVIEIIEGGKELLDSRWKRYNIQYEDKYDRNSRK